MNLDKNELKLMLQYLTYAISESAGEHVAAKQLANRIAAELKESRIYTDKGNAIFYYNGEDLTTPYEDDD